MKKPVPRLVSVWFVVAALLLCVAPRAHAAPGESIASYRTAIDVRSDGSLRITETIEYEFRGADRHGIFRRVPAVFRVSERDNRVYPIDEVSVRMDGRPVPVEQSRGGGMVEFKIGDPERTITGRHTYVIGYRVRGAFNRFTDRDELYWNAIGHDWDVPIAAGRVEVTAFAPIRAVRCFSGPVGSEAECAETSTEGSTAAFAHAPLGNGAGLTMVLALPSGAVSQPGPILQRRRDLAAAFRLTPVTVGGAVILGLLGVVLAIVIAWRVGRDRRYVGLLPGLVPGFGQSAAQERKPLIGAPPIAVEFGPPDGLRPGQVGTLIDERAQVVDVTATIVDFAVRRHLLIRELPDAPGDWELTRLTDGDPTFLPYERRLFDALFASGSTVRLSALKTTFASHLAAVRRDLYTEMMTQGWYRQSPARTRLLARLVAVGILTLSIGLTVLLAIFSQFALIGTGLIVASVALLIVAGRFPARTGSGSAVLARLLGFRLFIATADAEQLRWQERQHIFSEFLPYAIVFGLAERWATVFAEIGALDDQPGRTGSGLYWYASGGFNPALFGTSLRGFTTATGGAISTPTPSASGSSGFSAGGFSGGGAGGGGGGSW